MAQYGYLFNTYSREDSIFYYFILTNGEIKRYYCYDTKIHNVYIINNRIYQSNDNFKYWNTFKNYKESIFHSKTCIDCSSKHLERLLVFNMTYNYIKFMNKIRLIQRTWRQYKNIQLIAFLQYSLSLPIIEDFIKFIKKIKP